MSFPHRISTVFTRNESHPSKMAAQLFQIAVYGRDGCFEVNVFKGSEDDVRQLLAAEGCYNIQVFSLQLDDISEENPLVAVDQLSSCDESDLPEESETEVFYDCYEDLSEDQAVDSHAKAAQLFLVARGDRNGCKEIHGFSNMSEDEVKQLFSADGDENIQVFSVNVDDISDENPLVLEFHQLQEDGCLGPEFMTMELGSDFLNQIDGKGVAVQRNFGGMDNTQTSSPTDSSDTLKDVFNDTEAQMSSLTETDLAVESWMRYYIENRVDDLIDDIRLETLPVVSDLSSSSDDTEDDLTDDGQLESCVAVPDGDTGISGTTQDPCGPQVDSSGINFLINFKEKLKFFRSIESHRADKRQKEDHREDLTDDIRLETLPTSSSSCGVSKDTAICSSRIDSIEPESVEEALPVVYESSSEDENEDGQLKSFLVVADVHTYSRTEAPCRSQIESSGRISVGETKRKHLQGCVSYLPDVITEDPAPSSQSEAEVVGKKRKGSELSSVECGRG